MSDLTRDEIREACESVGILDRGFECDPIDILEAWRLGSPNDRCWLLSSPAVGEGFKNFRLSLYEGIAEFDEWNGDGPDLTTAAVRAVNQWAKTKKETTL